MKRVAIVDYGMCNLDSVARAVEECGGIAAVTGQRSEIERADMIILPGVGAFPEAMRNMKNRALDLILQEQVMGRKTPFLGICLGMQMLAETGFEMEPTPGLGWIAGEVRRLELSDEDSRIPHVGWNEVVFTRGSALFRGVASGRDFYFVHSYGLRPRDGGDIVGETPYGKGFVSAVERGHIFGVQFHPEKSQRAGFQVLRNFLSL